MSDTDTNSYVFAAVPYANAAPLVHFMESQNAGVRVTFAPPAELLDCVLQGRADAALIPVVDCFANADIQIIPGLGICADGDVQSVLLKCRRPLTDIRRVLADRESRTSNALTRVLLAEHFHVPAKLTSDPAGAIDAEVVIGDRALRLPPGEHGDYDLAGEWKAMTGLPFVFAAWAHRADHPAPAALADIARRAKDAGLAAIDQLAAIEAGKLELPVERCASYLRSAIRYDLGPREREGMELFRHMLTNLADGELTNGEHAEGQAVASPEEQAR